MLKLGRIKTCKIHERVAKDVGPKVVEGMRAGIAVHRPWIWGRSWNPFNSNNISQLVRTPVRGAILLII